MRKQRPPPKQRKVYRFLAKQGIICHGAAAVRKAAAKKQEAGRDMTADERRSKVIRDFYRVYKEYGQLDNVRYHMRVEMSGDALIEIHRYYGDRKGERILRVTHEEVEGAEVSAEVAAYEQAADQLIYMIKARRESLEENERRRQEARHWA